MVEAHDESKKLNNLKPIKEIIEEANIPTPAGEIPSGSPSAEDYCCPICRDAKVLHPRKADGKPDYSRVVPCKCAYDDIARRKALWLLNQCELPPASASMTFSSFKKVRGTELAYKLALDLAKGASKEDWLTLLGEPDVGKTHLAVAVAHEWLRRSKAARYAYVPLLLDELRRGFQQEGDYSYDARFQMFCDMPLLILDDLGAENPTRWVQERMETIIDYRLMHNLPLIVTSKCSLEELPESIASRLSRRGNVVFMDAKPYSVVKKQMSRI